MRELVLGVGLNDSNDIVQGCRYYARWNAMLRRCYSEKITLRHTTYQGCSVCDEWLLFSNFKSWMEQQDWKGKELDKDLLVYKNKVYSPETCVYLEPHINNFMLKSNSIRGSYPLGVTYHKRLLKYQTKMADNGPRKHLGTYKTAEEAHKAWQKAKIERAYFLKDKQTDPRVVKGLQRVIDKIQYDLDNNLITEDF